MDYHQRVAYWENLCDSLNHGFLKLRVFMHWFNLVERDLYF